MAAVLEVTGLKTSFATQEGAVKAVGGVDFSKWVWVLKEASVDAAGNPVPAVGIGVGEFLNAIVQFVIVAFAIFMLVKAINRISRREAPPPPGPTEEVLLLREIRDSLKR